MTRTPPPIAIALIGVPCSAAESGCPGVAAGSSECVARIGDGGTPEEGICDDVEVPDCKPLENGSRESILLISSSIFLACRLSC